MTDQVIEKPAEAGTREGVTVVTGSTFNDYVDDKLAHPAKELTPEQAASEELAKVEAEKATRNAAEKAKGEEGIEDVIKDIDEHTNKAKKGSLTERVSKLNNEMKEAREKATKAAQEAAELREALSKAEEERNALKAKHEPPKTDFLGPEPEVSQFTDINEYREALKDWTKEATHREITQKAAQEKAEKEAAATRAAWIGRQESYKKEVADYETTIAASSVKVSDQIRDAIIESDVGPQLLYHFAKNPEVAEKLGEMTVGRALKELGRLEAFLAGSAGNPSGKSMAASTVAEISKAPPPISPLRGVNAPGGNKVDSSGNFYGTFEEYKALRMAGKIK